MGRKQPEERNGSFGRNGAAGAAAAATIRHTQKEPQKDGKGSETFRGRRTSGVGGFEMFVVLSRNEIRTDFDKTYWKGSPPTPWRDAAKEKMNKSIKIQKAP
ncbi:hypothetical protein RUM44_006491 [Polyplax serrata]|uniref:Uncharacterized protein n=1 Tax=Polyplax serrata TaxID=468196 RepID=A0ABR1AJZ9_POLSC